MLSGLLLGGMLLAVLVAIIAFLAIGEFNKLVEKMTGTLLPPGFSTGVRVVASAGILALAWRQSSVGSLSFDKTTQTVIVAALLVAFSAAILITLFMQRTRSSRRRGLSALAFAAISYIAVPLLFFLGLSMFDIRMPLILMLCIWTNDTMAYIVGSLIGRTPFSSISPKKTWEGTAGGAILTIAGSALWAYVSDRFLVRDIVAVAACAAVFGTLGDLFESKLKRVASVKDSGNLMPGHGGALDRFDSLLVATPFAFCYLYLAHL
jgi:phosphatidate cytidylyltransferase